MTTYHTGGFLVVSLVAALSASFVLATEYVIGEGTCIVPLWTSRICDYEAWARQYDFVVGDTLVFNFDPVNANVAEVTKTYYDMCLVSLPSNTKPIYVKQKSPATITLSKTGTFYFINTLGIICYDQRLVVTVNATTAASDADGSSTTPSAPGSSHSLPASSSSSSSHDKTVEAVVGSVVAFILFTAKIWVAVHCYRQRQRHKLNAQGRPPNEAAPVLHHTHVEMNYEGGQYTTGVPVSNYHA